MSVMIKGMKMPEHCWGCACYEHRRDAGYYDYNACCASGTIFNDGYDSTTPRIDPFKEKLNNCPLVEVPPHGRLIDADKAVFDYAKYGKSHFYDASDLEYILAECPTIIEAEE